MNNIGLATILQVLLLYCLLVQAWRSTTDYCDEDLCTIGDIFRGEHIGCNADIKPSLDCGSNYNYINLEPYKHYIVERHNLYRNMIAGGNLDGFLPAVRMSKMDWDEELAYLARLNAIKCQFKHDACRSTNEYRKAGQNIHMRMSNDKRSFKEKTFIYGAVDNWFNEYKNSTQKQMRAYYSTSEHDKNRKTGHFTQIVNDKSNRIGCAAVTFGPRKYKYYNLLVCNYARTNILKHPIYEVGEPGSECTKGTDSKYTALCKANEPIDPNEL